MISIKFFKIVIMFIILTCSFIFGAKATTYTSEQLQKTYFEIGYTGIHQALKDSSIHFNRNIELPVQIPPIAFTHSFARVGNIEDKPNDKLEIEYINKETPENYYKIIVQPAEYGLKINENLIDQRLKIKGSVAILSTKAVRGFNLFVFEKDGFQYILSVDKKVSNIVTPKIFKEIANSIPE